MLCICVHVLNMNAIKLFVFGLTTGHNATLKALSFVYMFVFLNKSSSFPFSSLIYIRWNTVHTTAICGCSASWTHTT